MSFAPPDLLPHLPSFVALLRARSLPVPGTGSFSFLADGEGQETRLNFATLNDRARAIGALLQREGLAGERALLLYPPGLEFLSAFFGCLYAGVVAVPAYPPRLNRPMPRLRGIVADSTPRVLLTEGTLLADANRWVEGVPELAGLLRIATDQVSDREAETWQDPGAGLDSLAFLQYTSGSTAASKGVMVTHGNLLGNSAAIHRSFGSKPDSRGVFWLPLYHDMGLIGGVLQTIYCGGSSTLLSPVAFLQRPFRWLEAISRTGATISGGPNFAYDLCARKVTPEQIATLDLSRWSVAFNGAEPIRAETIDRFVEAFAPCGFRREAFLPCYGLAEATLLVSGGPPATGPVALDVRSSALGKGEVAPAVEGDSRCLVGSGEVAEDHRVEVVDPETGSPCPEGRVGEVWVSGPSVARGYWGNPEATEQTFRASLAGSGEGPFLRTGDLGFLRGGELFVTGRLKDLVIIRGRNVYPQDIEWTVGLCHPSLRPEAAAAFSVEVDGEERLIVVQEVERRVKDGEAIFEAIRAAVAEEHELDLHAVALLKPMALPRTSSGKVRRHVARAVFLVGSLETVATWTAGAGRETKPDHSSLQGKSEDESVGQECLPAPPIHPSAGEIRSWLAMKIAGPLGISPEEVDPRKPFASFGLGSLQAVGLAGDLEGWLGRPLSPTLLYDHPTIESLARRLANGQSSVESASLAPKPDRSDDRVAIIGIGCRFPGASGPDEFWRLLAGGVDAVGDLPAARRADFSGNPGFRGGFLDRVDHFDADFFGISPREAAQVDPQQRLLLEVAWEALEDAGQVPESLAGDRVGVFVGISTNDYGRLPKGQGEEGDAYALTGNAASIAANRISFAFDFRGPSLAIDTACSSSLVAVHLACRSLASGETTLAMAGGVNLILDPAILANFDGAGFLAPDGRCKAFDASANGYVRGEGAGLVVLKPLARAIEDGDPIYAVIRGGAVNQDGRSNGLTAPNGEAQEAVLRDAYRGAGVASGRVGYVEAHGTGTFLGDPIEAKALGTVLAEGREPGDRCALGSVKANIGHLEAAAGIAGLVKVALALKNEAIPPSLHFHEPNPHIPFDRLPLDICREFSEWPASEAPRIAGVSSFGFGGTNAHLVLEGIDRPSEGPRADDPTSLLLPLSARSPEALRDLARSYREFLATGTPLGDVCQTSATRRAHHDHRLALVASSADGAVGLLDSFLRGETRAGLSSGRKVPGRRPKVGFVFSGQGVQWVGMGRDLIDREPVFRIALDQVDRLVSDLAGWSVIKELHKDDASSRISEPEFAQPVQFALHVALAALWRSWGISPDAVVGHSLGEVSAAHVAGALTLAEAVRIVVIRGQLMQRVNGAGRTVAVGLSPDEAADVVAGSEGRIALAAINGPNATTLSGDPDSIADLVDDLLDRGVFARVLGVDVAYHGPQMDPIRVDLERSLAVLRPSAMTIPLISTVTGETVDGRDLGASYWGRNLRETVRFSAALGHLIASDHDVFLEVGPHPALLGSIGEVLGESKRDGVALGSLRRGQEGRATLLRSAAAFYAIGGTLDWPALNPPGRFVRLPSYPWQRERHWSKPAALENGSANGHDPAHGRIGHGKRIVGTNGNGHYHQAPPSVSVGQPSIESDTLFYEVRWEPRERPVFAPEPEGQGGHWLIFEDDRGVGRAIRESLEARGFVCSSVFPASSGRSSGDREFLLDGDGPEAILRRLDDPICGVVDLWPIDSAGPVEMTAESLETAQLLGSGVALDLVKTLAKRGEAARLWVATLGAQPAGPKGEVTGLAQAPLWGLGRSIALEYPGSWGGLIDLDPDAPGGDVDALIAEMIHPVGEDQVAFREGRRHVARMARVAGPAGSPIVSFPRPEGTYLVTGGLGDLGLKAARWLVDRGARRVVLLGRRGLPPRVAWDDLPADHALASIIDAIRTMEREGATILVAPVDVADDRRMTALFERLKGTLPPIRGVIHAAGVVGPRSLRDSSTESLLATFRPKVAGTWVLHQLCRSLPLDFLVNFSSVAAVLGAKEGSYAAANQFLDAFARWAGAKGLPILTIGWGPWSGSGMAADQVKAHKRLGLEPLQSDRAFQALERAMELGLRHVVAADLDWFTFRVLFGRKSFLEGIEDRSRIEVEPAPGLAAIGLWRESPPDRRREELVRYFRDRVAGVLRLDPRRIDPQRPLDAMGLDSIMAIELKSGVEADLGTALPLISLLEGPTIHELADRAIEQWARPASTAPIARPSGEGRETVDHPPSLGQRSLWFLHRRMPDDAAYNMAGAARVRVVLDVEALRQSLQFLVNRHASLRTTFPEVDGEPVQRVEARSAAWFRVEDASTWSENDLERRLAEEARRPFDLESGPLFRTWLFSRSDQDHYLVLSAHHIVGDFWSIAVLMHEMGLIYPALRDGSAVAWPPIELQYADFARWQREMLARPEGDRLRSYWTGQLAGPLPVLDLPTDRPRPAVRSHRGSSRSASIDADLTRRLVQLGSSQGASLYVTLLAAFQVLLGRLSDQEDVIVGSPVAGRDRARLTDVVGYFANPLPIRADLSGDPTFEAFLGRVRRVVFDGLEHQDLPFAEMVELAPSGRDPARSPIFQVMFVFQKAQRLDDEGLSPFVLREAGSRMDHGDFPLESVAIDLQISQFDLTLSVAESEGGLAASLEYSSDLFDADTIDRMLARFQTLLAGIVDQPDHSLSALPILPDAERRLVLEDWNPTETEFPPASTIHARIETQAERSPEAVAVVFEGHRLSYRNLNEQANRLAHHLRTMGVGPGTLVGIAVDRSVEMVVGLLAILKAGGAYVPLDPDYPRERLAFLLDDAGVSVLLTVERLVGRWPDEVVRLILIDADREAIALREATNPVGGAGPDDLAYVIYTSGSTGTPKGVEVTHRNLVLSTDARSVYYREPVGAFLLVSSFAFDSSVAGLFWTLCQGGRLVIPSPGAHADPIRLAGLVAEHRVTHWLGVPSLLGLMLSEASADRLDSLRVVIAAGEPCPRYLPGQIAERLPLASLHNEYGPTEATVWSTVHDCRNESGVAPIPIGRPIAIARAYILDDGLQPRPIGVPGELYIGGAGVARGYLNRPVLTTERFLPDPFGRDPGGRLYRTGDRVRWRADGTIEFLGRLDDQLKIRGFRVEPGEIEATLARHPEIREAVAIAREDAPGDVRLVAYLIPRGLQAPPSGDLRRWLKERLPDSLVPSAFVAMEAWPLSPNGKVDRKALPAPDPARDLRNEPYEAPRDAIEEALARVAASVLSVDRVGVRDDLFDLGLDSILAIQIVSRVRMAGWKLDPGQVFEHPTIAGLAAVTVPIPSENETDPTGNGDAVEQVYPLSPMQEGMLFHSRVAPASGVYVQQFTCPIDGEIRIEAFEAAWRTVIARHPVLRTSFEGLDDGRPRQNVHRWVTLPLEHHDWRGTPASEIERRLETFLRDDRDRGFDPSHAPLLRLAMIRTGAASHRLVLSNHHALMDGWCVPIVLGEVLACYEAALEDRSPELPPTRPYRDYIAWLQSRDGSKAETFWRRELKGVREATPLPFGAGSVNGSSRQVERRSSLSESTTAALRAMARAHRMTLGTLVQGAWAMLLGRYAGREEVVFGVTVSGRPADLAGVETMVGLFINTLPVRVEMPEDAALVPWLASLQSHLVDLRRHEATPLARIQSWSDVDRGRPLFESIVVYQNYPDDPATRDRAARIGVGEIRALERTNFPLTITAVPGPRLAITAAFDAGRFDENAVGRLLDHLANLLGEMVAHPRARLADLSLASTPEIPPSLRIANGRSPDHLRPRNGDGGLLSVDPDRLSIEEVDAWLAELSSGGEATHE